MFRMVVGHSDEVDVHDAIASVLAQCREALGPQEPKAGLLFSTHGADPQVLLSEIRGAYPDIELIGSTSAAEMSSVLGYQEDSVTLALFASDNVDITAGLGENATEDPQAAARAAIEQALAKTDKQPRLCMTMPSFAGTPNKIVASLQETLGKDVTILGGGAALANMMEPGGSLQFYNDRVIEDGVPVLMFSGPLTYSIGVDTGWKPVGKKGTVTRADDTFVIEIDDAPAVEFFERYLGKGAAPTPANPLAVYPGESGEFYLRGVIAGFDEQKGSLFTPIGAIPEGVQVQIAIAMTEEIFDGSLSAVRKAIKGYPEGAEPDAALLISCAVRKFVLGTRASRELEIARRELGEKLPICGFYCFGEIAPLESGTTHLHNETMVAVLLGAE